MSKFDPERDRVFLEKTIEGTKGTTLHVKVASYDGAERKLGIVREAGGDYRKLGRLTLDEAEALLELLPRMIEELKADAVPDGG